MYRKLAALPECSATTNSTSVFCSSVKEKTEKSIDDGKWKTESVSAVLTQQVTNKANINTTATTNGSSSDDSSEMHASLMESVDSRKLCRLQSLMTS